MRVLISSLLAAVLALLFNPYFVKLWGDRAIAVIVPIAEELLKTLIAVILSASIFYTHFSFGVIEAIWDMRVNTKGFQAAIFSLLTHSLFGFITLYTYNLTGFLLWGIILSIIIHIIWNSYILRTGERVG